MGADELSKLGRLEQLVWGRAMMAGWVMPKVGTSRQSRSGLVDLEKRAKPDEDGLITVETRAAILQTLLTEINSL